MDQPRLPSRPDTWQNDDGLNVIIIRPNWRERAFEVQENNDSGSTEPGSNPNRVPIRGCRQEALGEREGDKDMKRRRESLLVLISQGRESVGAN